MYEDVYYINREKKRKKIYKKNKRKGKIKGKIKSEKLEYISIK